MVGIYLGFQKMQALGTTVNCFKKCGNNIVQEAMLTEEFGKIEGKSKELALKTTTMKPIKMMTNFRPFKNLVENFTK